MKTSKHFLQAWMAGVALTALSLAASPVSAEGPNKAAPQAAHGQTKKADQKAIVDLLGVASPSATKQAFSASDLDNDGVISLDEFHKDILRSWHALDLDHDGEIRKSELESIPDRGAVRAMLRLLKRSDSNGDLKLSFKELVEARMAFFDEADANRDDRLTLTEVLEFESKHRAKFKEALADSKRDVEKQGATAAKK